MKALGPTQTFRCTRPLKAKESRKQDKKNKTQGSKQGKLTINQNIRVLTPLVVDSWCSSLADRIVELSSNISFSSATTLQGWIQPEDEGGAVCMVGSKGRLESKRIGS